MMKPAEVKGLAKTLGGPEMSDIAPGVPVAVQTAAGWMPYVVGAEGALKPVGDEPMPTSAAAHACAIEFCAKRFAEVLADWLTPAEQAVVVERNRSQMDPLICHSHDFCDANMAMLDALQSVGIISETFSSLPEEAMILWCAAWDEAKRSGFYFEIAG
ncbi:hypothetical protein [Paraburkholderia fungorum]|jgi:hypothetical protein|nr:hypothetical protein [Paraburkholderia fungorum]